MPVLFILFIRGLIIAMTAHVLLAVGKMLELAYPESPLGALVSLAGYCLLAGVLTVKVYRVLGTKGRKRRMMEASIMEVTAAPKADS
jgi:hypothetical protein